MNNFELSDSDLMNEVSKFRYYEISHYQAINIELSHAASAAIS